MINLYFLFHIATKGLKSHQGVKNSLCCYKRSKEDQTYNILMPLWQERPSLRNTLVFATMTRSEKHNIQVNCCPEDHAVLLVFFFYFSNHHHNSQVLLSRSCLLKVNKYTWV